VKLYVDASVLLRVVLGEPGILREWRRATRWISSELIRLECLRTLDRARVRFELADESLAARRGDVLAYLEAFELVDLDPNVLARAADPFPTALGTLDAVHLSTALLVRARVPDLVMATHDRELAIAARSLGLRTAGVAPLA
jgi:uncharacterized protein